MIRQRLVIAALAWMTLASTVGSLGCGGGDNGSGNTSQTCSSTNPLTVAGTYHLSVSGIDSSTCPSDLTAALEDQFFGMEETQTFTQNGAVVTLEPGVSGCVDDQGNVHARLKPQSATRQGCTVRVTGTTDLHLAENPSHATITANVRFSGPCRIVLSRCSVVVGVEVDKLSSARSSTVEVGLDDGDEILSTAVDAVLGAVVNGQ